MTDEPKIGIDYASGKDKTKVGLWDSETHKLIASFDTVDEAIEYADDHDLKCYIKAVDFMPELNN